MKPKEQRIPNLLLRRQRLLRGWSLQRVADEICALAVSDGRMPGVSVAMVSCWEMGKKKPSPFYQERLCLIYGLTADQLGFMDAAIVPSSEQPDKLASLAQLYTDIPLELSSKPLSSETKAIALPFTNLFPQEQRQALDLLIGETLRSPDEQLGAWLTLGANHLSILLDAGWSCEQVLDAVRVVLQGVQGLPAISRRKLLELGAFAIASEIFLSPDSRVTESERARLSEALGKGIGESWKLFHTVGHSQALLVSDTLLYLIKQHHYRIYPNLLPIFYSGVYRLNGAALYFQGHYDSAWKALEQSYVAALESADTWNMAQSRSWQAYIWNAKGNYKEAFQATEAALRLITQQEDTENIRLRARLLAFGATNAALLGNMKETQERLEISKALLEYLPGIHEEFDQTSWLQEAGICALKQGQYELAADQLQLALTRLPAQWTLRYVATSIPLAISQVRLKQAENALNTVQKILPIIKALQSERLAQEFMHCLHTELVASFPQNSHCQSFAAEAQRALSNSYHAK